jgi:hypothetical protein
MNVSTTEPPPLELALKTLWGATRWPGFADSTVNLPPSPCQEVMRRLHQLVAVRASGVLHGPNGVGKSFLLHRWSEQLSPKQYRLAEVGIHASPFEAPAQELLLQSADGSPRTVNALLQRSFESAAVAGRRQLLAADVQAALDLLPWIAHSPALRS